ncbi:MAG: response regulator [Cyanobacteriota bacterium]|nr:response regulator [Cyanobacteriota bacterium]
MSTDLPSLQPPTQPYLLIVEDDPDLASVLTVLLDSEDFEIYHAANGERAIALLQQACPPLLLVLDLSLPQIDGFAVVDWLRTSRQWPNLAIIIYTARDFTEQDRQRLQLGQTQFFTKSRISPPQFQAHVLSLIRQLQSIPKDTYAP